MFKNGIRFTIKHEADSGQQGGNNGGGIGAGNGTGSGEGDGAGDGGNGSGEGNGEPDGAQSGEGEKINLTQEQFNDRLKRASEKAAADAIKKYQDEQKAKEDQAKLLAGKSEAEKLKIQNQQLQQTIDNLAKDKQRTEMVSTARTQLVEAGIKASDEILNVIVTDDAESTSANIKTYIAGVKDAADVMYKRSRQSKTLGGKNGGNGDGDGSVSYGERLAKEAKARNQVGNNIPFHRGQ